MSPGEFSFHRGSLALDFVGTVGARASNAPVERLPDTRSLARWLRAAGLVTHAVRIAPNRSDLEGARALREALARSAQALIDGAELGAADIAVVNAAAADLACGAPLLDRDGRERWTTAAPLRFALARIAADGIAIFSNRRERLTRCELDGCGAFLLSRARGEARRWCSMETCGNRAKVAKFRARASSPKD